MKRRWNSRRVTNARTREFYPSDISRSVSRRIFRRYSKRRILYGKIFQLDEEKLERLSKRIKVIHWSLVICKTCPRFLWLSSQTSRELDASSFVSILPQRARLCERSRSGCRFREIPLCPVHRLLFRKIVARRGKRVPWTGTRLRFEA